MLKIIKDTIREAPALSSTAKRMCLGILDEVEQERTQKQEVTEKIHELFKEILLDKIIFISDDVVIFTILNPDPMSQVYNHRYIFKSVIDGKWTAADDMAETFENIYLAHLWNKKYEGKI